ncbi:triose-phosphate isomerase, partial [Protaetiibacter mangrovi]
PVAAPDALEVARTQVRSAVAGAPAGRLVVAYEPVWAIGAPEPAGADHIRAVTSGLQALLAELPGRDGSAVIYGGSAGPGLLARLGDDVDGLFLGRFAHDPAALREVLAEAEARVR